MKIKIAILLSCAFLFGISGGADGCYKEKLHRELIKKHWKELEKQLSHQEIFDPTKEIIKHA